MRRRDMLSSGRRIIHREVASVPVPAISQGFRKLTKVTDWPEAPPRLQAGATTVTKLPARVSGTHLLLRSHQGERMLSTEHVAVQVRYPLPA
jgi:hypothetical protein